MNGAGPGDDKFHDVVDGGDAADADDGNFDIAGDLPNQTQRQGFYRRPAESAGGVAQDRPAAAPVNGHANEGIDQRDRISATIFVTRESQKGILLGKQGAAIKKLGTEARKKIEAVIQKKVFLELTVKVVDNWRDDEQALRRFGYEE